MMIGGIGMHKKHLHNIKSRKENFKLLYQVATKRLSSSERYYLDELYKKLS